MEDVTETAGLSVRHYALDRDPEAFLADLDLRSIDRRDDQLHSGGGGNGQTAPFCTNRTDACKLYGNGDSFLIRAPASFT